MKKPFCPMVPAEAMLRDKNITPRLLRALLALYTFADQNGDCYPKRAQLADMCGMREAEISRATTDLQRIGWLTKTGNGGRNTPARYRLHAPETVHDSCTVSEVETVHDSCTVSRQTVQDSCTVSEVETVQESCTKTVQESCTRIKHTNEHTSTSSLQDEVERATRAPAQEPAFELQSKPQRKPAKRAKHEPPPCLPDVQQSVYARWLAHRPAIGCRKPWTADAQARHVREAEKAGLSNEAAFEYAIAAQWQAFTATYYYKAEGRQNGAHKGGARYESAMERNAREAQKWLNPKPAAHPSGAIIDVEPANRGIFQLLEKTQ